jgi:small-conductance mechanosensitive channel
MDWDITKKILLPVGILLISLAAGWVFQKLVSVRLRRAAQKTLYKWDDVLVRSLKGLVLVWFFLAGASVALKTIALSAEVSRPLQKGISLIAIFSAVLFFVRLSSGIIRLYLDKITGLPTSILRNVAAVIIYVLGFLVILDYLGISITPILTALGVGGLAVALALQDTLSNLFAGLNTLMAKNIRLGDYIKLQTGEEGFVADITWRNVTIRALANNLIIIPNSKLAATVVTNFHLPDTELSVLLNVGVSYDSDLRRVEEITQEVAAEVMRETQGGLPEFKPFIRYSTFGDFSINFTVILRGREYVDQYLIKHEFVKKLHERFKAEGIEIPFPIRTVHLQNEGT